MKYKMLVVKAEEQVIRLFPALIVSKKKLMRPLAKSTKLVKK
jgi:acetylornithine/succinyldiaminopimelate/putrescine aminotransferase